MSPRKKTESYNLYSCLHLTRAKINLKVDKNYSGSKKVLKYSSKPNPLLTINSSVGQTTVFLPPTRSWLKAPDELADFTCGFQYNEFPPCEPKSSEFNLFSNSKENEASEMFPSDTSVSDEFEFSNTGSNNSRYMPNILKTKSAKMRDNLKDIETNNNKDSVKNNNNRKRKQTYNLSVLKEDGLVLNDPKEKAFKAKNGRKRNKIEERCKEGKQRKRKNHLDLLNLQEDGPKLPSKNGGKLETKKQKKPEEEERTLCGNLLNKKDKELKNKVKFKTEEPEKRANHIQKRKQNSCARLCPFMLKPLTRNKKAVKLNKTDLSKESLMDIRNSEETSGEFQSKIALEFSTESQSGIEEFVEVSVESQTKNEHLGDISIEALLGLDDYDESQSGAKDTPIPINDEFLIPDYKDYLSTSDLVVYSDEVHKLISPTLCDDAFDVVPPVDVENMLGINDLKSVDSNSIESKDSCRKVVPKTSCNESINSPKQLEFEETNSIKSLTYPVYKGVKDSLINGCSPIDLSHKDYQDRSNLQKNHSDENTSRFCNPQVTIALNKFFLSCAHVECYAERDIRGNCDLHSYDNDLVPVSPNNLEPNGGVKKGKNVLKCLVDKNENQETKEPKRNLEKFKCPECDFVFAKKRTLAVHQSKAHLGSYSYSCKRCSTLCNSKVQLQRHSLRCFSSVKKPFICRICQKKYSYSSSLKEHFMKKHGNI